MGTRATWSLKAVRCAGLAAALGWAAVASAGTLFADDVGTYPGSNVTSTGPDVRYAKPFVPTDGGVAVTAEVFGSGVVGVGTGRFVFELRADDAGKPGALLGSGSAEAGTGGSGTIQVAVSNGPTLVAGTPYWAVVYAEAGHWFAWLHVDTGTENVQESVDNGATWALNTLPNGTRRLVLVVTDDPGAPVAVADTYPAQEDVPLVVAAPGVLGNDLGVLTLSASLVTQATRGLVSLNADGSFSYTPTADTNGTDSFTYRATQAGIDSNPATVTITVGAVNDPPRFTPGPDVSVLEDSAATLATGWATGIAAGPSNESGQTAAFAVTANSNPALFSTGPTVSPSGDLEFTPAPEAFGTAQVTLTLQDTGGTADGGVDRVALPFNVTVEPVNDRPTFTAGPDVTVAASAGPQTFPGWATGASAGPANEAGQSLTYVITGNSDRGLFLVEPALSPAGELTFTPAGTQLGLASVTAVVMDDGGRANGGQDTSTPRTFTLQVVADPIPDSGVPDGGPPADGGTGVDGGMPVDGGSSADGGAGPLVSRYGCSSPGGLSPLGVLLLLAGLLAWRRR